MIDTNIRYLDFNIEDEGKSISYNLNPISLLGNSYDLRKSTINLKEQRLNLNFSLLDKVFLDHAKALISFTLMKYSETTVYNYFKYINQYFRVTSASGESIDEQVNNIFIRVMNDKSVAPETKSYLRSAYRFFAEEEMPYFDQDFVDFYLDEIKFGSGNKGIDVLVEMKDRGCLTLSEQRKFKEAIGIVDYKLLSLVELHGFIALRIGQLTGARDIQIRKLKGLNFFKKTVDSKAVYSLKIPRVKQKGQSNSQQTVIRPITQKLGEQIEYLLDVIRKHGVTDIDNHFLLFPIQFGSRGLISSKIHNKILLGDSLLQRINFAVEKMNLDFKVTLRRLRKTFCSSLVARGVSMKVIAYLMDHSDLQQLGVYYRQTHSVAKKIDVILRKEAGDILDAFAGKIIKVGEESLQGQAIFAPTKDAKLIQIGSCGSGRLCVLNPPLSCYGCKSLEAFEDVDHSEILDQMTANAKDTFGNEHALQLAQDKNFLAAGALIQLIESGDYE